LSRRTAISAADFLPQQKTLAALREAARGCQGCDLYRDATQTVFGEGSSQARLILIGEQPGDREDIEGHPFVGPAGRLLDESLAAAGIDRKEVYVTNAVKHFKWTARGKRRLHKKPGSREIVACHPWLLSEIEAIHPQGLICLGATAAQALLGSAFRITRQRGEILRSEQASWIMATYHPSAVLRAPDEERRREMHEELIGDLKAAAGALV
jgi:DNA polymerase